jgi:FAD/FMN-containing dehydrogenase
MTADPALERLSWGRYPRQSAGAVVPMGWRHDPLPAGGCLLPRGSGRSYGDSCLNAGGTLVDTAPLDHVIAFDRATGILRCEAGMTLARILELVVPAGWFLPVTPGTRFVTLGGAIANDVHGKNHHAAGTFGCHVRRFELLRSDGARLECAPDSHVELFAATIGGLGLTGLVTWAEIALRPIRSARLDAETVPFSGVDEFLDLSRESNERFEHTVAWVDATARGNRLGRGLFMRANHVEEPQSPLAANAHRARYGIPFDFPAAALSRPLVAAFNTLHFHAARRGRARVHFDPFFYPLDGVRDWNRVYGRRGFVQHQSVVPAAQARDAVNAMLEAIASSGEASFLSVLKVFGARASPGLLSFPRPGATLALDFPMRGAGTLALLDRLDAIVMQGGGAIYPAKDARMSPQTFARSFPRLAQFERQVDPAFSSSFWRRVHRHG